MISGINEILNENAPLIAIIGEDKIFPMVVSEGVEPPFLATSLGSQGPTNAKNETSGLDFPQVNINVHCKDYDSLEEVSDAVREALDNINATTDAGYTFPKIWFANQFDRPDLFTPDRPLYARTIQFNVILKR